MFGDYFFYWGSVWAESGKIIAATLITIEIAVLSIVMASVVGIAVAVAASTNQRTISRITFAYIESMRNSPSLVKMFFIFFGFPSLGLYPSPIESGVAALVLHNGAYIAEIFRGGINAVPTLQIVAAQSLGMRSVTVLRVVTLPQAFRRALPTLTNNWVEIVKDTSITSAVAVPELFHTVTALVSENMRSFEFLGLMAVIYLVLTTILSVATRWLEFRLKYPL